MQLVVARIARPRGLTGEVALDLRTDQPQQRLAVGAQVATDPRSAGPLTVTRVRAQSGRWYVTFQGVEDRDAAEALRGVTLVIDDGAPAADGGTPDGAACGSAAESSAAESSVRPPAADQEEDAWYPYELVGLRVEHVDGRVLGTLAGLEYMPAHDLLVVIEPSGTRSLVPFVRAIVPVVDVPGGRIVLDPPGGLLADEPAED